MVVCQSGGEFVTNGDRSMLYTGGEAHAMDIDRDMLLNDLKSKIPIIYYVSLQG